MQRPTYQRRNNNTFRQQGNGRDMELERLHQDVRNLTDLLERERQHCCKERNEKLLISQELEETKQHLTKQKTLKEMYINRGKDTRRELERLEKYSNEETLSAFKIAQKVNDTTRQRKKKDLHVDYEELKVAYVVCNDKFTKELQSEKEKNKVLQEELDSSKVSYHELKIRYEADVLAAKQLVETLQCKNEQQGQSHAERVSRDQQVISTLKAELDVLGQKAREEIAVLQQAAFETENMNFTELEGLKTQLSDQKVIKEQFEELQVAYKTSQDTFTAELQKEKDNSKLFQEQLEEFRASSKEHSPRYQTDELPLTQKTEEKIKTLQQMNMERESIQCEEVEELKTQIQLLNSQNKELSSELEAHLEDRMLPTKKRASCEEKQGEPSCMEETLPQVTAEAPGNSGTVGPAETVGTSGVTETVEATEAVETMQPQKPEQQKPWFKRVRHFLGLRKPESWKEKKEPSSLSARQ